MLEYIFSLDFVFAVIRMGTPLLFVGMAAVIGAKADILCIAYEGMMLFAALGGVIGSAYSQNLFVGMVFGLLCGLVIASIFAYFVLYLDTKPLLTGLALNTLGTGGTVYVVFLLTGMKLDTSSLHSLRFPAIDIPMAQLQQYELNIKQAINVDLNMDVTLQEIGREFAKFDDSNIQSRIDQAVNNCYDLQKITNNIETLKIQEAIYKKYSYNWPPYIRSQCTILCCLYYGSCCMVYGFQDSIGITNSSCRREPNRCSFCRD